jgi:hypothetical protein
MGKEQSFINFGCYIIVETSSKRGKINMAHQSVGPVLPESDSAEVSTLVRLGVLYGAKERERVGPGLKRSGCLLFPVLSIFCRPLL